jgi:hypothetical protein
MQRSRVYLVLAAFSAIGMLAGQSSAFAGALPSGETTFGKTVVEPAYNGDIGSLIYLSTPMGSAKHINPQFAHNVAPIYLPVYPVGSNVGVLNCENTTATTTENCPDHGPGVAGAAVGISAANGFGSVYANGVQGHDHLVGVASTGGDFNILWEPVLVLFTNSTAANEHVTTISRINALVGSGAAIEVPLPALTFPCAIVPAAVYNRGTPFQG